MLYKKRSKVIKGFRDDDFLMKDFSKQTEGDKQSKEDEQSEEPPTSKDKQESEESEESEENLDWIHGTEKQLQTLKKDVNKLPDKVQVKKSQKSIGYFYLKYLKSFLSDVSLSKIYKKYLDIFLQQFSDDYEFILNNPQKKETLIKKNLKSI